MFSSKRVIRATLLCAGVMASLLLPAAPAKAEIFLTEKKKPDDWEVSITGRVDAYLNYIWGETINTGNSGNLVDPTMPNSIDRYTLVGPQIAIRGNPVPDGAVGSTVEDKRLSTFRIRGGFASTVLAFNVYKQIVPDLKLSIKAALWAGIQNAQNSQGVRQFNDSATVDFREQYMDLSGSWGSVWGGRRIGLFNRGGMRMNWFLMHQHGVGHPCDVDSAASATCGHTGTGSLFPSRHAQLGYATPDIGGLQLSLAALDPAMIDTFWNRTLTPRFEAELTFKKLWEAEGDEVNVWANGMTQQIGRVSESPPNMMTGNPGIPADRVLNAYGFGGGVWGRVSGFGAGATAWTGKGLGTAWSLGNTAVDAIGELRNHFGYLAVANYRFGNIEVAASYGSVHVDETKWDANPNETVKISVIDNIRAIGGKLAYHMTPLVFSIDGMNLHYTWHRGEEQTANTISAGMLVEY